MICMIGARNNDFCFFLLESHCKHKLSDLTESPKFACILKRVRI